MAVTTVQQAHTYLESIKDTLQISRSFQYYNGQHRRPFVDRLGESSDNIIINLAKTIVDVGVAYLFGQEVLSQVQGTQQQAKQDYLDLFWQSNERQVILQKAAVNGGIAGHSFIRILQDVPFPRLVVLDPAAVDIQTDPNDISQVWCYTITPQEQDLVNGAVRTLIQSPSGQAGYDTELPNDRWEITDQELQNKVWVTTASETWPYTFPPIADCQNTPAPNLYWGVSDLSSDIMHLLDSINRVASSIGKTLRYFSHPIVYTKGMGSRQIDRSVDSIIHLPSSEASMNILEMQSDLGSSLSFLDRLLQYLSMTTRIPGTALGVPDNLGPISGVALKIRYAPLIQKTEQKRLLYGHMIQCIDTWILEMGGFGPGVETNLQWFNLVPSDDLQEAQVYQAVDNLGIISKRTMADRLGLDYDSELKEMSEEQELKQKLGLATNIMAGQDNTTCPCCGTSPDQCTCVADCPGCTCSGKGKNLGNNGDNQNNTTGGDN